MKTQLLTTAGKMATTSSDGFVTRSGPITVRLHPASDYCCASVQINATYHCADECVIGDRQITIGSSVVTW